MFNSVSAIGGGASVERVTQLIDESNIASYSSGEHGWVVSDFVVLSGSEAFELVNAGPDAVALSLSIDEAQVANFGNIFIELIDQTGQVVSTGYKGWLYDHYAYGRVPIDDDAMLVFPGSINDRVLSGSVAVKKSVIGFQISTEFFDDHNRLSGVFYVPAFDCTGIRISSRGGGDGTDVFDSGFANLKWSK